MKIPSLVSRLATLVAVIASGSLAHAAVISVNFAGDDQGVPFQYTVGGTAGVVPVANWNNYYNAGGLGGNGLHFDLTTDSGSGAGASTYINYVGTANPDALGAVWGLGTLASNISNPNAGIYNNYLNYFGNGGQIYFNNLGSEFTDNGYNVIVYFSNPYDSDIYFNLNDGTQTHQLWATVDAGAPFTGFVRSTATTVEDATVANYVVFSGITAAGFGLYGGGTAADPAIAAIQIVAVPEPSTVALSVMALGGALLVYRRRRS